MKPRLLLLLLPCLLLRRKRRASLPLQSFLEETSAAILHLWFLLKQQQLDLTAHGSLCRMQEWEHIERGREWEHVDGNGSMWNVEGWDMKIASPEVTWSPVSVWGQLCRKRQRTDFAVLYDRLMITCPAECVPGKFTNRQLHSKTHTCRNTGIGQTAVSTSFCHASWYFTGSSCRVLGSNDAESMY
ncbi:hypothetical protein EYF80_003585 [Liparis tanakae]|uniref:Uncharacterized protein n=1 Tax=Liparis tanakae TaxID=230148 RepID=A0A4Z2J8Z3_9TELE|nr:hypothetical protein EYF80_003585 [Liparis tanakae]